MNRLIEKMVFSGLVTAWRLATCPTSRSPVLVKPTTDGVIRLPSGLVMTTGSPPSMTATQEFVVPRSMPMILLIVSSPLALALLELSLYNDHSIKCESLAVNRWPTAQMALAASAFSAVNHGRLRGLY